MRLAGCRSGTLRRRVVSMGCPAFPRGPYRFIRHPNYAVVVGEIAVLPLVFGEVWIAVVFTVLNAAVLFLRIREEEGALAARRVLSGP